MKTKMTIKVETVQHGFALEIGNKSWLLESEQELAEAVMFRIGLECQQDVTKHRLHKLLNMLAYGDKKMMKTAISKQRREKRKTPYQRTGKKYDY